MSVPLISEYVEAIKLAEDNLDKLSYLRPILNSDGNPIMSGGNFAVVFKMRSEKDSRHYALKCFIKDQPERDESYRLIADELEYVSSEYLVHVRYLEKELFVDTASGKETEFPVLLMDWVEGVTLDKWIRQHLDDQYNLQLITYQFCRMASWLMNQPFAHGDLKPDNIIVRDDGSLVLVDYDGMYVPAMQGQKSRELGSPDYRHSGRTPEDFNEHIDDFSLAAIAMQLCAIALDSGLFANQTGDTLLLTETDHRDLANSNNHHRLHSLFHNIDFERLYALYLLAHAQQTLSNVSFRAFYTNKPIKKLKANEAEDLSTEATDEDIRNGVRDEYGALYSPDGKRLLKGANIESYRIKTGTRIICNRAFSIHLSLISISIPESVTDIGDSAFWYCENLTTINIPNSVTNIGVLAFSDCATLKSISIPNSVTRIEDKVFSGCSGLTSIIIPNSVKYIGNEAFGGCSGLTSISIPNLVIHIGNSAFWGCHNLTNIIIPDSVTHIGDSIFMGCKNLISINFPDSIKFIGNDAFLGCESLTSISIPKSVTLIGNRAFGGCSSLKIINITDSTTQIGNRAFTGCTELSSINIPNSVMNIGDEAFSWCTSLKSLSIPNSVINIGTNPFICSNIQQVICNSHTFYADNNALYTKSKEILIAFFNNKISYFNIHNPVTLIGDKAFWGCHNIKTISISNSVTHIGYEAFGDCHNLASITIPNSVTFMGDGTFAGCSSMTAICIPDSVTHIGDRAFVGCTELTSVNIPYSITRIGNGMFGRCTSLASICIPNSITHIGDAAFAFCASLKALTIPISVTYVGKGAFGGCTGLKTIHILNPNTHIWNSAFDGCNELTSIYIHRGSRTKFERMLPKYLHDKLKEQL